MAWQFGGSMVRGCGLKSKLFPLGNIIKKQKRTYYAWTNGSSTIYTQNDNPEVGCDYSFTEPNEIGDVISNKTENSITVDNINYSRNEIKDRKDLITDFYFEIKTDAYTSGNTQFYLPITNSTYVNPITVDWGDGNSEILSSGSTPSHTYATAGTYEVKVHADSGKMPGLCWFWVSNDSFKYSNKQLVKVKSALMTCYYNDTLPEIDFSRYFYETSITTIPSSLFRYNTSATKFRECFYNCQALTKVPQNLFKYNIAVTNFSYCFRSCSKLQLNPNIFCDETTEMTTRFANVTPDFSYCFSISSFAGTQGTAPQLWNYTYNGTPTSTTCFTGHSTASLTNYNDIPSGWK